MRKHAGMWQAVLACGLRLTGIPWFMREIYARRKVTVVNYHDPKPAVFAAHMKAFRRLYSFIDIKELVHALERRDFSLLPRKPLLVTLDDGYAGNSQILQVLTDNDIPVVIYAIAGAVDTARAFWFDRLVHDGPEMRRLKTVSDCERRRILEEEYGHTDEREYDAPVALSRGQLLAFAANRGTIGSHSVSHPMLERCSDDVGHYECTESRRILEELTGAPVRHFALPDGSCGEGTKSWVASAGYATCRTTVPGWVTPESDLLALPNFGISDDAHVHKAIVQACGLWSLLKRLVRRA